MLFHETNTRIAHSSPYRALSTLSRNHHHSCPSALALCFFPRFRCCLNSLVSYKTVLVVFPLSRAVVQMQVLRDSALRSIDDYSTFTHSAADAFWCGSPRPLFWRTTPERISVGDCALTYKGAAALPPHHTPLVGRWLFLGTTASRASGTALKQALPSQTSHPCSNMDRPA